MMSSDRIPKKILDLSTKREKKFRKSSKMMKGLVL
jgi:hypothetical protein